MRFFLVLAVIVSFAVAFPGNGYNYGDSTGGFGQGLSSLGSSPTGSFGGQYANSLENFNGQSSYHQQDQEEPLIRKQFHIYSAPEDHSDSGEAKRIQIGRTQKNYRVVFIKAPSSGDGNAKLAAEYAPSEEKTHIYVLSQNEAEFDANNIATPAPTQPSKPEVFFIKYKTPEEAAYAQQQIQTQYDALGGTSEVSDEGSAPEQSFVGSLVGSASNLSPLNSVLGGATSIGMTKPRFTGGEKYLPTGK